MSGDPKTINLHYVFIVGAVALALAIPYLFSEFLTILLTRVLILAIVAVSLNMLIGYSGIGALGHATFFAIGAYTTAILVLRSNASFPTALAISILVAAGISAIAALLILRAKGLFQLMISLSIAMCVWGLIYRWVSLTAGENGLTGISRKAMNLPVDLTGTTDFYYFVLFVFAICFVLMVFIINSPYGKTLVGIRDAEERMRIMGYNVWLHKYLALVICGSFAGLAGCLHVFSNNFIAPDVANLATCMDFVLMVIIGGPGTVLGGLLGSFIVVFLKELVSIYTERWVMIMGIIYIFTAIYAAEGVMGLWHKHVTRRAA